MTISMPAGEMMTTHATPVSMTAMAGMLSSVAFVAGIWDRMIVTTVTQWIYKE
jgi:hypothetical protein